MFANQNWRHARLYGGNSWAAIVRLALQLAEGLRAEDPAVHEVIASLKSARHNTGTLSEKLNRLEKARLQSEARA